MARSMNASVPGHGGKPVVGLGAGVRQAGVDADDRGALALRLHDPLGVRVEVVARLEVGRDEEDHLGVGEVATTGRSWPIQRLVADAGVATSRCWCGSCGRRRPTP